MLKSAIKPNTRYRLINLDLVVPADATASDIAHRIDELLGPGVETGDIAARRYPCLTLCHFPHTQVITSSASPEYPGVFATADALKEITGPKSQASSIKVRFNRHQLSASDAIKELARTFPTLANHGFFCSGLHLGL